MSFRNGQLVFGLTYHGSVAQSITGLDNFFGKHISAAKLREQLDWLRRRFNILTVAEVMQGAADGTLPPRSAFIAFHDGYAGNYEIAFPLLRELGIRASFYVPTAFLGTDRRFWVDLLDAAIKHSRASEISLEDLGQSEVLPLTEENQRLRAAARLRRRLKSLPQPSLEKEFARAIASLGWDDPAQVPRLGRHDACLDWRQVKEMAQAGMEFGSHTHRHLICAMQDEKSLREELTTSKGRLEDEIGMECRYLCYPNGDYPQSGNDYTDRVARECGYQAVLYMISPYNLIHSKTFRLTGVALGEETSAEQFKRALSPLRFRWYRFRGRRLWPWESDQINETGR
jgi:peptidoglycan/xylan/chitin deacetylase (PgdA/CDA1 family)